MAFWLILGNCLIYIYIYIKKTKKKIYIYIYLFIYIYTKKTPLTPQASLKHSCRVFKDPTTGPSSAPVTTCHRTAATKPPKANHDLKWPRLTFSGWNSTAQPPGGLTKIHQFLGFLGSWYSIFFGTKKRLVFGKILKIPWHWEFKFWIYSKKKHVAWAPTLSVENSKRIYSYG